MASRPFQGVVTPEAVLLEFETAGIGSRGAAAIVDITVRVTAYLLFVFATSFFGFFASDIAFGWIFYSVLTFATFFVLVGYPVIFESLWDGRTPGKAMFGLRVVTLDGSPISFRHAAIRGALAMFELLATFGALALLTSFFSSKSQRLGDYAAGTLVLRERNAVPVPKAITFNPPPAAEHFVETLDVASVQPEDYAALRSYLVRLRQLNGPARAQLGEQLAGQYATKLRITPPAGMSAEVFLTCVAAAYQRRFAPAPAYA